MKKELFFIDTEYGELASCLFLPEGKIKALIVTAHGYSPNATMSEHARLIPDFAEQCCNSDIAVLLFDFRGHGLSASNFKKMSPNTRIEDLTNVMEWAINNNRNTPIFLHGFSMGGATAIHISPKVQDRIQGLITWCAVPTYDINSRSCTWHPKEINLEHAEGIDNNFLIDRPKESIEDIYSSLSLPKIQIQGTADLPYFLEEFVEIHKKAKAPKQHYIIEGADHIFSTLKHRDEAIKQTIKWVNEALKISVI